MKLFKAEPGDFWSETQASRTQASRTKGFTLIELLVVISIIALLAAILFPVFARVRETARRASCASNLKQIALAFTQYGQDYDGRFPQAIDGDPVKMAQTSRTCPWPVDCTTIGSSGHVSLPTNEAVLWPAKLQPYLKSRQIFSCPSVKSMRDSACAAANSVYRVNTHGWPEDQPVVGAKVGEWYRGASQAAYGYNVQYLGGGQFIGRDACQRGSYPANDCYTCGAGARESSIEKPAETVLLIDQTWTNRGITKAPAFALITPGIDSAGDFWCRADGSADDNDSFDPRHNGGLNVAFADGHVKWMKKEDALYRPSGLSCGTMANYANDNKFLWDRF